MRVIILAVAMCASGCGLEQEDGEQEVGTEQPSVDGEVSISIPPSYFSRSEFGAMETGRIVIDDGSSWQAATIAIHCTNLVDIKLCVKKWDPDAPNTSTNYCTPSIGCRGDRAYNVPFPVFFDDAHDAMGLTVQSTGAAIIASATLVAYVFGS